MWRRAMPALYGVMPMAMDKGRVSKLGCWVSGLVAEIAATPYAQIGVILFCLVWFAIGWGENALTAALSILAITLTQMVLNTQYAREAEATRRDVALHAKLDELIIATKEARNEIAGVEELEVEEIEALKEGVVTPLLRKRRARG
jgi:low affinity Fe/Cu permease